MIPYGHQSINGADIRAVIRVLKSDWLTQGPAVEKFERNLAKYCGVKYAVAFSSGTAALHGAYFAAGLKKNDEFITTPLTFAATSNAGLYLGAKPVFADVDGRGNMDCRAAEKKITKKTRLISVVDYAGHPAELNAFKKLAKKYKLVLIEDAAHALGASYGKKKIGSISDMTIFSFHPVKSITTGEGGAVLTNNKEYFKKLALFRSHGITKDHKEFVNNMAGDWYHEMQNLGFNYRMTDIQAALGASQLERLNQFVAARKKIARVYDRAFSRFKQFMFLPTEDRGMTSAWHLYPVRLRGSLIKQRAKIFAELRGAGIGAQVHYIPVYLHPYYKKLGYKKGLCSRAEAFYASEISLPIFPSLFINNQKKVVMTLIDILKSYSK